VPICAFRIVELRRVQDIERFGSKLQVPGRVLRKIEFFNRDRSTFCSRTTRMFLPGVSESVVAGRDKVRQG